MSELAFRQFSSFVTFELMLTYLSEYSFTNILIPALFMAFLSSEGLIHFPKRWSRSLVSSMCSIHCLSCESNYWSYHSVLVIAHRGQTIFSSLRHVSKTIWPWNEGLDKLNGSMTGCSFLLSIHIYKIMLKIELISVIRMYFNKTIRLLNIWNTSVLQIKVIYNKFKYLMKI